MKPKRPSGPVRKRAKRNPRIKAVEREGQFVAREMKLELRVDAGMAESFFRSVDSGTPTLQRLRGVIGRKSRSGEFVEVSVAIPPSGERVAAPLVLAAGGVAARRSSGASGRLEAALSNARARGRNLIADILRREEMLNSDQMAEALGTTRETVNRRRQRGELLALKGATRGYRYPGWQLGDDGQPVEGLPAIIDSVGGNGWDVYRFLTQVQPELGGDTPIDALRAGRSQAVLELAEDSLRTFS